MSVLSVERINATSIVPVTSPASIAEDPRWSLSIAAGLFPRQTFEASLDFSGGVVARFPVVQRMRRRSKTSEMVVPSSRFLDLMDVWVGPPIANHGQAPGHGLTLSWDVLRFSRVRTRSSLLSVLESGRYKHGLSRAGSSAYCSVSDNESLGALSRDHLRNVDRLRRRAQRDVGLVDVVSVSDASASTRAFDRFVALENAGWKGTQGAGTSLAADSQAQAFFRDVVRRFQEDGRARLDFLTIAGRDAAAHLAIRAGPTWFLLKICYHPDFKDVGPGGILLKAFLEEMRDTPDIREVNLTTNPPWAARWHFQTEPVYHVSIYNTTWRGRLLYVARSVKELAKALRNRYRALRPPAPTK